MDDGSTIIHSTRGQIEAFKDSLIWKDLNREMDVWLETINIERDNIVDDAASENPSTASVLLHLGDVNGRIKAINFIKELPDTFLEIIKIRSEEKKHGKDD